MLTIQVYFKLPCHYLVTITVNIVTAKLLNCNFWFNPLAKLDTLPTYIHFHMIAQSNHRIHLISLISDFVAHMEGSSS